MATEPETQQAEARTEPSSVFDGFFRNRDLFLVMPFFLGFSNQHTHRNPHPESPENSDNASSPERIILVNPFTQGMVVLESSSDLDPLLRTLLETRKEGRPPASKASIDAIPVVEIGSGGGECVICLEDLTAGDTAKEMQCKHRFHGECIDKWLGIHGSCPVCRYEMPVDEDEISKKRDDGGGRREIWVRFSFNDGGRRSGDSEHDGGVENGDRRDTNTDGSGSGSGSGDRTDVDSEN